MYVSCATYNLLCMLVPQDKSGYIEPRVRVWKLKEEKTCEEFRCMVGDKVEERPFTTTTV